jgi:SPP1 family predicted phage head-tail adaptor
MSAIGQYRHVVTVQNPAPPIPDGEGGYTETWTDAIPALWDVRIAPLTARDLERLAPNAVITSATAVIQGRYHDQITTMSRLLFEGRIFILTGVSNPDERQIETMCLAVEVLGMPLIDNYQWTSKGWMGPEWVQEGTF